MITFRLSSCKTGVYNVRLLIILEKVCNSMKRKKDTISHMLNEPLLAFLKAILVVYIFCFQIDEEVSKLLALKAQLSDEQQQKFVLKCPKVNQNMHINFLLQITKCLHDLLDLKLTSENKFDLT